MTAMMIDVALKVPKKLVIQRLVNIFFQNEITCDHHVQICAICLSPSHHSVSCEATRVLSPVPPPTSFKKQFSGHQ